ncbi:MAG: PTS galactitol transporter subunit IIB [Anaerolineae bacterium]|jgi:PTS system galactitol-specific IIB component|nr:PTS galactitol transporter subunit IIB [Anaerolineae bacterium]
MYKVKIIVVCGSGVAMAMHAAFKLREALEKEKLYVHIDGTGNNELASRIGSYDMVVSNAQVTVKTDKPVFSAIPLITGVGEKELLAQIVAKVKEIQEAKNGAK